MPSVSLSDSEPRYDSNDSHEGDRRFFDDIELIAVSDIGNICSGCFFVENETAGYSCRNVNCRRITWVTPLQYITRRLTK